MDLPTFTIYIPLFLPFIYLFIIIIIILLFIIFFFKFCYNLLHLILKKGRQATFRPKTRFTRFSVQTVNQKTDSAEAEIELVSTA